MRPLDILVDKRRINLSSDTIIDDLSILEVLNQGTIVGEQQPSSTNSS